MAPASTRSTAAGRESFVAGAGTLVALGLTLFTELAFAQTSSITKFENLSIQEVVEARTVMLPKLKQEIEEAASTPFLVKLEAPPIWSGSESSRHALLPLTIKYSSGDYVFCRFVTISTDLATATVINSSEIPDCLGMEGVLYADINGDGPLDGIEKLRVQSNRYDLSLLVPAVFMSDPGSPGGYCYSQQASNHLEAADLVSAARVKTALDRERRRLQLKQFACSNPK